MPWQASLSLHYQKTSAPQETTRLHFVHDGPLRVLQSLYPEGRAICHNVLVHPPGGLVQGDLLDIQVQVDTGAHAFISTPGATRFYRSETGQAATQRVHVSLSAGARLEWLPLETLAYPGCNAINQLTLDLQPDAQLLAWDVTALGLPAAGMAYENAEQGVFFQRIHWPTIWLEQGGIAANDHRLLNAPLGLAGQRCMGTLFLAHGTAWSDPQREALLETLRTAIASTPLHAQVGVTSPHPKLIVLRALAPMTEPLMTLLKTAWACLRHEAWGLKAHSPRIWAV
jgi:urease accessory protein